MASSRSVRAGSAFVEFFLNDSPLKRGLSIAERRMRQFGANVQNIGRNAFLVGAAGIGASVLPVKQMMAFDDAIRMTGAVSQSSAAQLEQLRQRALELGRTTSFTAVEVASLMGELGRAGFKTDEINAMTDAVLNLSRASGTDAVLASGIMAATLRQFTLGAGDAARVSDVLTLAANSTFNSVESLGESLSYAGPVAAQLGMSLEDTVAILGTLGNVGIQGSNAGTALRRMFTITAAEAGKMREIFGVEFLDAAGNVRPIITVLGELSASMNGLPSGEKISKMNEAFGLLGITGATVISESAANTQELANQLLNAAGVAATTATTMDAGPGGAFRRLTSAIEGASIAIGYALAPQFEKLAAWITDTATVLTDWIAKNENLIVSAVKGAGALAATGLILIIVGKALQAAAVMTTILSGGISVVTFALSALATVIAATSAIATVVASIFSAATVAATTLAAGISLATVASVALNVATMAVASIVAICSLAYSTAATAIAAFNVAQIASSVATYASAAAHGIANALLLISSTGYAVATWAASMFTIAVASLATTEGLAAAATMAMNAAIAVTGTIFAALTSPIGLVVAALAGIAFAMTSFGNPITIVTSLFGSLSSTLSGFAGEVMGIASTLLETFAPAWDVIVAKIGSGDLAGAMRFAWELTRAAWELGTAYIMQGWGAFSDWLATSVQATGAIVSEIWGALWDGIMNIAAYAWAAIKDTLRAITNFGHRMMGRTPIEQQSNVSKVSEDAAKRAEERAQSNMDSKATLDEMLQAGQAERQSAVDSQLAKIDDLISTEKARTEQAAQQTLAAQQAAPTPQAQQLQNTLAQGTREAMQARSTAVDAVDKNTVEGQKLIYELLNQSSDKEDTVGAIASLETTLVDESERTRRENAQAPRLSGSRKS